MQKITRAEGCISAQVSRRIAALADVVEEDWMQDWPLEACDETRVEEFLALYVSATNDDDKFALMALILASLDERDPTTREPLARRVEDLLVEGGALHGDQVFYWSCFEKEADGSWSPGEGFEITPMTRRAFKRLEGVVDFVDVDWR